MSHLLITAVSLECGYAARSIRKRIYAVEAELLLEDPHLARSLRSQFDGLIAAGGLRRLALPA